MAKSKKRRKILVFSVIGVVLAALTVAAIFRKREAVITIQTEKVIRTNITEIVTANGKIQPVVQVKISPEVSGEIIALPVKEGQCVQKGQLILKIKPDFYLAARSQAEAGYKSSLAAKSTAEANLRKAQADFKRSQDLSRHKLVSDSDFDSAQAAFDVAEAQLSSAEHQVEMARASLDSADDALAKTTIVSPLSGTVSKLDSEVGERVVGTATMAGTEVMTVADLNEMEARVDIGEMDVILIQPGQNVRLEVDAFKDRKFNGTVTEIADSAKNNNPALGISTSGNQEATKFEVKIRVKEKEAFRPGMSVTAEIETRSHSNVLAVPFASVTVRAPKAKDKKADSKLAAANPPSTNSVSAKANNSAAKTNVLVASTNAPAAEGTNIASADKKSKDAIKTIEVVFVVEGERVKMVPIKKGIYDDTHWEITEGLQEGQEIVSGGYRAIARDLEDGKKIRKGPALADKDKEEAKGG
ncbi:MAG TPA: efflux RND transporter periplasmic adaptor subunit [Candidatus Binatia bacterium]|jgi:HlyD family secretion protein|nr:efflux RND transporter periplasmic adaptor subunit [Candidatus Binatia bacterium]